MNKKWATLGIVAVITAAVVALGMSDFFLSEEERDALQTETSSDS